MLILELPSSQFNTERKKTWEISFYCVKSRDTYKNKDCTFLVVIFPKPNRTSLYAPLSIYGARTTPCTLQLAAWFSIIPHAGPMWHLSNRSPTTNRPYAYRPSLICVFLL